MVISIFNLMWVVGLMALVVTIIVVPFSIKLAKKTGAMDIPDGDRRIHEKATPRIGGIAIFVGATVAILIPILLNLHEIGTLTYKGEIGTIITGFDFDFTKKEFELIGILIAGAILFLGALVDDYKQLPATTKLCIQIISASLVYGFGVEIHFVTFFFEANFYFSEIVSYFITVIWIVAITNTINLIDGLDGLASGTAAIASTCIAYVAYIFGYYQGALPMMAIAGAAIGFLFYNFYPAKTFMGDCGAQYLGFLIASFAIVGTVKSATLVAVILPGIALSLPIFDTMFAIVRRKLKGQPIMSADKGHFHHRLLRSGMGQRRTVLCMYGICGILGVASIMYSRELYLEMIALILIDIVYVIVVLTDINGKKVDEFLQRKTKNK